MEVVEKINITPDRTLFPKLGQTGYTVGEALAELIDNSIDAREEKVNIAIKINTKNGFISVEDDGVGMNKEKAKESIILGRSSKKQGELGQFGIGLKTACMSLGKKFTVETTTQGSDELYSISFDEEEFVKSGSWSEHEIKIRKGINHSDSGTKILIEKLKIKNYPNLIEAVKKHLSERFGPFVRNKEAIIKINSSPLEIEELKIILGSRQDFCIDLNNGSKIVGWTGILEVGSVERSGFNLYRYGRLIRAHEKLGYVYHPSKMWITGEIHLDTIPVTHNKREFITEDPLYIEFFDKFQEILKPVLVEAQKRHREEKIKDLPRELRETLKDNLMKALDKVGDFKELAFPNTPKISNRSDEEGMLANQEKRANPENITETKEESHKKERGRTPNKTSEKKVRFITIAGKKYQFDYEWQSLDDDIPKEAFLDKERALIMIILNSHYSILNVIKPDWFYHALYLTEGIVEVFLKENEQPLDKAFSLRDKLVKKLADVISEDIEEKAVAKDTQVMAAQSYLLKNKEHTEEEKLTNNEKEVLKLRLEDGLTIAEISELMHVSRQRVSHLLNSGIFKINYVEPELQKEAEEVEQGSNGFGAPTDITNENTIINSISTNYNIDIKDLLGDRRKGELIFPRHLTMYLLRKKLNLSFPQIAKIMKRKDHTTIMYACEKIDKLIKEDKLTI